MSDEIKNSAGNAGDGIQESDAALYRVEVKCPRPVYRRAGYSLVRGKNAIDCVIAQQLAVLNADPMLSVAVVSETPVPPGDEERGLGVLDVGDLNERIRAAVATLDKDNPGHYTRTGAPRVSAVAEALDETITGEQLKAAMAETDEG